jgi:hypothetical protein
MKNTNTIGIRKRGILHCFREFHDLHQRYPSNCNELSQVTSTILHPNNFDRYRKWYFEFTGETEK